MTQKKDGKLHRQKSANKDKFRSHLVKTPKKPKGSKVWFFDKAGKKRYVLESCLVVHSKK